MNAAFLALLTLVGFGLGYLWYSKFLAEKIFRLLPDESVPAHEHADGIDFVATPAHVLWGHHYASIAGAAPIVGPAIAVIWGWLPALLWVILGTITMGAVHDFGTLVISLRHRGQSIGEIAGSVIGPRAKTLFLLIISFLIWVVLAVFAYIIGALFVSNPGTIFPINVQIIVAMLLGWLAYRLQVPILIPSLVSFVFLLVSVYYGDAFANAFPAIKNISIITWVWLLLIYSFVASVLPVWLLLQPRDYLNSHQLVLALSLLFLGLIVLHPTVKAPALDLAPPGAPPIFPFLFITVACGAISGFHGLVASGTTSKQVDRATDARAIGYGGMLGEGFLGMLAVLAATAGFATTEDWHHHYSSWAAADGLNAKLGAFINGGATFIHSLGIPVDTAKTFIAVTVIAFAATSLDTAARIQRLIIEELARGYTFTKPLQNRFVSSGLGIGLAILLAITSGSGKGGLILWPLLGTTNQLVAGVALLIITIWLERLNRPIIYTAIPTVFVSLITLASIVLSIRDYVLEPNWLLTAIGSAILILDLWVLSEGSAILLRERRTKAAAGNHTSH